MAGAISMDGNFLYVTSGATPTQTASGSPLLNVIDLTKDQVVQSVVLPSIPQGVEVGNDGRALVSMLGTGVVSGIPQGTLAVFDRTLSAGQQLLPVTVPALPTTPAPLPATTLTRPTKIFTGSLLRTPDGQFIVGVITPTASSTYIFVYEVASGVVLRNRTVSGSVHGARHGSRRIPFHGRNDHVRHRHPGDRRAAEQRQRAVHLYRRVQHPAEHRRQRLLARTERHLYSAFNTAANTTPPPPSLSSTLLVNDPANLGIQLGNQPAGEHRGQDGDAVRWLPGLGPVGFRRDAPAARQPVSTIPFCSPQTTPVFLAQDDCNRGVASGVLQINNLGKGRLTFAVVDTGNSALVYQQSSGLAPATITFTMEPGRSGVVRQPGTNIWTGAGHLHRDAPERDAFFARGHQCSARHSRLHELPAVRSAGRRFTPCPPCPTTIPITSPIPAATRDCRTCVLDEPRGRLYVTNSGYNRIEVFEPLQQQFVAPIPVGQCRTRWPWAPMARPCTSAIPAANPSASWT